MRPDLPTGTVTFLFTDVEGSTRLLHELGPESYAAALAQHRRSLREAFAAGAGVEVDTQGDAFFVAFPTAQGAVTAALAARETLTSGPIRVRMGLHTGTPVLSDEGYVGVDVHRAARVAALAHGGQIVVSPATFALLDGEAILDLGVHRLKDFDAGTRLYQIGGGDFPPLRTPGSVDLPIPATRFLGREHELFEAITLVYERSRPSFEDGRSWLAANFRSFDVCTTNVFASHVTSVGFDGDGHSVSAKGGQRGYARQQEGRYGGPSAVALTDAGGFAFWV